VSNWHAQRKRPRRHIPAFTIAATLAAIMIAPPVVASASFPTIFKGDVGCAAQPSNGEVRLCGGPTTTWDGQTKIDVNVILPPAPTSGPDGPYPLIGDFHGWGGSKIGINEQTQGWAEEGYAVFSMSDRGWGNSCGSADPDKVLMSSKCTNGYNHLMDDRFEVRDAQYLISVLADEGVAEPQKIGATGFSYGGGISMALAALRNRVMLPDGSLAAWESPDGKPMSIAAAVPQWPWTDLAYSLMPNGRTLDYVADSPYLGPDGKAPIGIQKSSFVAALYGLGLGLSNYAPPGADKDADLTGWYALENAGEPYAANPMAGEVIEELTEHHSSYYIDHGEAPAPLLIQNGWNDDLFPADEAIRFYNRTRTQYPGDPISLYFMDDGHMRSQNKQADEEAFEVRQNAWFDHYLKEEGSEPKSSVEILTTTCSGPSQGPYKADSWKNLAPGEVRFHSAAPQTIVPGSGDPSIGQSFDPIAGPGACATASGADQAGTATYRLPAAPAAGFTLAGSPTILAKIEAPGGQSEIAARLLDVSPTNKETLVARGLLRPGEGEEEMVFQLHPQAYRFAAGEVPKLELLPSDAPYARPSNLQAPIAVSNLELRLPVLQKPGSVEGVEPPETPVLPPGYEPAIGYTGRPARQATRPSPGAIGLSRGRIVASRKELLVHLNCTGTSPCAGTLSVAAKRRTLAQGPYSLPTGATQGLRLKLTKAGRKMIAARLHRKGRRNLRALLSFADSGRNAFTLTRPLHLSGHR
jgi:predicted acyl esterase